MKPKPPKPKKCDTRKGGCGATFNPARQMQKMCGWQCAQNHVKWLNDKKAKQAELDDRKQTREKLEKLKKRGDWIKEAQSAINRYRRLQEHALGRTCISCQRPRHEIESTDGWKPGGAWDAGHFQSVGRKPELRFHERNIWLQCKSCNAGSSKYARKSQTVEAAFEANLRVLIGDAEVDWLKGPHEPLKLTVEAIKQLRDDYRAKTKDVTALSESRNRLLRAENQINLAKLIRAFDVGDFTQEVCGKLNVKDGR